jgi:hypothetical protein
MAAVGLVVALAPTLLLTPAPRRAARARATVEGLAGSAHAQQP